MHEHKIQSTQNMYRSMSTYFNSLAVVNSEKKVMPDRSIKTYQYIILHELNRYVGYLELDSFALFIALSSVNFHKQAENCTNPDDPIS